MKNAGNQARWIKDQAIRDVLRCAAVLTLCVALATTLATTLAVWVLGR